MNIKERLAEVEIRIHNLKLDIDNAEDDVVYTESMIWDLPEDAPDSDFNELESELWQLEEHRDILLENLDNLRKLAIELESQLED